MICLNARWFVVPPVRIVIVLIENPDLILLGAFLELRILLRVVSLVGRQYLVVVAAVTYVRMMTH